MSEERKAQFQPSTESYWLLSDPEQRAAIKRRSLDMVEATQDMGTVFFLDKTARPLGHLFRKIFPLVYPNRPKPVIKYLNIGSEKGGALIGYAWRLQQTTQEKEGGRTG